MMHRSSITCAAALPITLLASGCWYEPVEVEGRACTTTADCIDGYRCEARVCVLGAPIDAGLDAHTSIDARALVDVGLDATSDAGSDGGPLCLAPEGNPVDLGYDFGCAIVATSARENQVVCWGDPENGRTGVPLDSAFDPDAGARDMAPGVTMPVVFPADAPSRWASIALGTSHACAIGCDRSLWCWGRNGSGELASSGPDSYEGRRVTLAETMDRFDRVTAGRQRTCAWSASAGRGGTTYCWGADEVFARLGTDGITPAVANGQDLVLTSLETTQDVICAISDEQRLYCWGNNHYGQLAGGSETALSEITSGGEWLSVAPTSLFVCGLARVEARNRLFCWGRPRGYSASRLFDVSGTSDVPTPLEITLPFEPRALGTGRGIICVSDEAGDVYCWGEVFPTGVFETAPTLQATREPVASFVNGLHGVCAVGATTGHLSCFGRYREGEGARSLETFVTVPPP